MCVAYGNCGAGIGGNMTLGAVVDIGVESAASVAVMCRPGSMCAPSSGIRATPPRCPDPIAQARHARVSV